MTSISLRSGLTRSAPSDLSLVPSPHRDTLKALTVIRQKVKLLLGFLIHDWNFSFPPQLLFIARCWHFSVCFSWVPWQIGCFQKNQVQCSNCVGVGVHIFMHPAINNACVLCDKDEAEEHLPRIASTQVLYSTCLKIPTPVVLLRGDLLSSEAFKEKHALSPWDVKHEQAFFPSETWNKKTQTFEL